MPCFLSLLFQCRRIGHTQRHKAIHLRKSSCLFSITYLELLCIIRGSCKQENNIPSKSRVRYPQAVDRDADTRNKL